MDNDVRFSLLEKFETLEDDPEKIKKFIDEIPEVDLETNESNDNIINFFSGKAELLMGRYNEAEEFFNKIPQGNNLEEAATIQLACLANLKGNYIEAEKYFDRVQYNPPVFSGFNHLGIRYAFVKHKLGKHNEAISNLNLIPKDTPDFICSLINLAIIEYERSNYHEALNYLNRMEIDKIQKVCCYNKENVLFMKIMCYTKIDENNIKEINDVFSQMLPENIHYQIIIKCICVFYIKFHKHKEVEELLEKLDYSVQNNKYFKLIMQAWLLITGGKYVEGEEKLNKIPKKSMYYNQSLLYKAIAKLLHGELIDAKGYLEQVKDDSSIWNSRKNSWFLSISIAEKDFDRSRELIYNIENSPEIKNDSFLYHKLCLSKMKIYTKERNYKEVVENFNKVSKKSCFYEMAQVLMAITKRIYEEYNEALEILDSIEHIGYYIEHEVNLEKSHILKLMGCHDEDKELYKKVPEYISEISYVKDRYES